MIAGSSLCGNEKERKLYVEHIISISGSPALRFGALFGLGWGMLLIANYYLVQVQGARFTTLATLVISLAVYLVAGLLAAAQTGTTSTGLVAGLLAGLFSSLLNAALVMILLLTDHALLEKMRRAGQNFVHVTVKARGRRPTR